MARIVVAMSGGVDSSVAAALMRRQGHEVIGLFMRHGEEPSAACRTEGEWAAVASRRQGCCSAADAADARRVAEQLNIPFFSLEFSDQFARIVDYFCDEYLRGRTPNPCIVCNTWLKFGRLFAYADAVGAEFVATGHYARLDRAADGLPAIFRAADETKDQSYVLFGIERRLLPRILLPVGGFAKAEIRRLATDWGLPVAEKPDSQEICFVPDDDHAAFVRARHGGDAPDRHGEIVSTDGQVLGTHEGIEQFTVGQRKGLRVACGQRRYVVRIEPDARRVVIGRREELARTSLVAREVNWLVEPPSEAVRCRVKIRYRSPAVPAIVEPRPDGSFFARFEQPVFGVAPGQAAVCYDGDRLLGGGWIE